MKLFRVDDSENVLKPVKLDDILEWIVEKYPEDVFTGESGYRPALVARMRDLAKILMASGKP
jgi:hypothetical protein